MARGQATKELYQGVKAFLTAAGKELAQRELAQRKAELAYHQHRVTETEGAEQKGLQKVVKELERSVEASVDRLARSDRAARARGPGRREG